MIGQWQAAAPQKGIARPRLWPWLGLLVAGLALLGGSARPDAVQDVVLRPLAALLLIPALAVLRAGDLARLRVPLLAGATLLAWMSFQLVPLPPALWQALPGRDLIAGLGGLAGAGEVWRPIALAPFRGLGSLLAMLVPVAVLLLAVAARVSMRLMLLAIAALGATNALLGILQVTGGTNSPFYLYAVTNLGAPVGIFANENHASVFAAVVLLVLARLAIATGGGAEPDALRLPARARLALGPAYLLVLIGVLIGGSRAGLACTVLAMLAGLLMAWTHWRARPVPSAARGPRPLALLAAAALGVALVIAAFLVTGRAPAAADVLANSAIEDIRWSLWPILVAMIGDHWVAGTGFGSFEAAYRIYEPTALLMPLYINQAHNDWAQLVIEGGLPAMLCLFAIVGHVIAAIIAFARHGGPMAQGAAIFWTAWLVIMMAASLVDYPLRTPTFQAVAIWLLLCLAQDRAQFAALRATCGGAPASDRIRN